MSKSNVVSIVKREDIKKDHIIDNAIIAESPTMLELIEKCKKVAQTNYSVLLVGETGTGKELLAQFIYQNSKRANEPFITVNCGAIPENLLESELFGHKKGAFTDARTDKIGKFELADQGTIFLDEIGDMSLLAQQKLLRVLNGSGEVYPVGSSKPVYVDVRVVCATNTDLAKAIKEGRFREDLYHRISTISLEIPPLRERKEDLDALIDYYFFVACREQNINLGLLNSFCKNIKILQVFKQQTENYPWPGNVRELINKIRSAVLFGFDSDFEINKKETSICIADKKDLKAREINIEKEAPQKDVSEIMAEKRKEIIKRYVADECKGLSSEAWAKHKKEFLELGIKDLTDLRRKISFYNLGDECRRARNLVKKDNVNQVIAILQKSKGEKLSYFYALHKDEFAEQGIRNLSALKKFLANNQIPYCIFKYGFGIRDRDLLIRSLLILSIFSAKVFVAYYNKYFVDDATTSNFYGFKKRLFKNEKITNMKAMLKNVNKEERLRYVVKEVFEGDCDKAFSFQALRDFLEELNFGSAQ